MKQVVVRRAFFCLFVYFYFIQLIVLHMDTKPKQITEVDFGPTLFEGLSILQCDA